MGGTQVPLHGYVNEYDSPNLKLYEFTSSGVDNGYPPVTNLTELCPEVKNMGLFDSGWEDAFEELVPGFKNLNRDQKTFDESIQIALT